MSRSLKELRRDLIRVDRQIAATLESTTMNTQDRQITLEGFMRQKQQLDNEKREMLRRLTAGARDLPVEGVSVLADGSGKPA